MRAYRDKLESDTFVALHGEKTKLRLAVQTANQQADTYAQIIRSDFERSDRRWEQLIT